MRYLLFLASLALIVSACDNPTSNNIAFEHEAQNPTGPALPKASFYFPTKGDLSMAERRKQVQEMTEGLGVVLDALDGVDDAATADRRLTEAQARVQGVARMTVQQLGSITMLERYLNDATLTDAQADLATKHVRTLTETGNPEAEVIARALDHLGDRMPAAERVRLADTAVASVRREYDLECDDCEQARPGVEAQTLQAEREGRRQAVQRLERIVVRGGAVSS